MAFARSRQQVKTRIASATDPPATVQFDTRLKTFKPYANSYLLAVLLDPGLATIWRAWLIPTIGLEAATTPRSDKLVMTPSPSDRSADRYTPWRRLSMREVAARIIATGPRWRWTSPPKEASVVPTGDAPRHAADRARTLRAFGQCEDAHPARPRRTEGSDDMTRLSDTQTCLLSAAANRDDRSLLPPPDGLKAHGGALQRTLAALLRRGLIAEVSVRGTEATWRTEEDGRRIGLAVTDAGLAAIGIDPASTPANGGRKAKDTETPQGHAARPKGKLDAVLTAIEAADGATLEDLTTATGWLPHTTRAAITRLRQRGFAIELAGEQGARRYRVATEAA